MNEKSFGKRNFEPSENEIAPIDLAIGRLRQIQATLKELGFDVYDKPESVFRNAIERGYTFPIVEDGLDGIRVTYRSGELVVSFTNGFEKSDDPRRLEVVSKLYIDGVEVIG